MPRKIPGKKHRGIKDPEKQKKQRLESLKGKINLAPANPDFQEIPHSIIRIADLKQKANKIKNTAVNNALHNTSHKTKRKHKRNDQFKQKIGETDRNYLYRVKNMCNTIIQENAFENKYGVDIKRNPKTRQVEKLVKKKGDVLDKFIKESKQNAKIKKSKKRKSETIKPHLTKSQKRRIKLKEKKLKTNDDIDFEGKETIKFGEIVHAPPTLSNPRYAKKLDGAPRPGQKNLLLKSILEDTSNNHNDKPNPKNDKILPKTVNKVIDKKGKRKNLPNALRRKLDKQQIEIINAYRALKKQKNISSNL